MRRIFDAAYTTNASEGENRNELLRYTVKNLFQLYSSLAQICNNFEDLRDNEIDEISKIYLQERLSLEKRMNKIVSRWKNADLESFKNLLFKSSTVDINLQLNSQEVNIQAIESYAQTQVEQMVIPPWAYDLLLQKLLKEVELNRRWFYQLLKKYQFENSFFGRRRLELYMLIRRSAAAGKFARDEFVSDSQQFIKNHNGVYPPSVDSYWDYLLTQGDFREALNMSSNSEEVERDIRSEFEQEIAFMHKSTQREAGLTANYWLVNNPTVNTTPFPRPFYDTFERTELPNCFRDEYVNTIVRIIQEGIEKRKQS